MNPLLIRRRGMMAKEAFLPDGQLEWIETDGVAYIDTGYTPNVWSSAIIKTLSPHRGSASWICGVLNGTARFSYFLIVTSGNATFAYNTAVPNGLAHDATKVYTIKTKFVSTTNKYISITPEGGAESNFTHTTSVNAPNLGGRHLFLFANNASGTPNVAAAGTRIYLCELFSDSNLTTNVKNYVPWRLNGEVGLMDTLTNTFYGNAAGSGAFTGGPNVI